jgi:hypothetical protein
LNDAGIGTAILKIEESTASSISAPNAAGCERCSPAIAETTNQAPAATTART